MTKSVKQGLTWPEGVLGQLTSVPDFGVPTGSPDGERLVNVAPVLYCTELL